MSKMLFTSTQLEGAFLIDIEPKQDERGFFARTWCRHELAARGLDTYIAQESISYNRLAGTVRGLHFQRAPHEESKIVRCTRGAIFDVIVDLRRHSCSYLRWQAFKLTAENRRAIYIPKGVAHGFQTLTEHCEIGYQISAFHAPEAASGYRFDDSTFQISWPLPVSMISERDLGWSKYEVDAEVTARK
jgi:dTDP-4-dehydrorhamnose 3,5-epimerase